MNLLNMAQTMVGSYTPFEAWTYDRWIAPGVVKTFDQLLPTYLAEMPARASLLDVGCGGGQLLLEIARHQPSWQLTGLDLSAGQIKRARQRARKQQANRAASAAAPANINFVEGSAMELPFADHSFDAVISVASIKHWPEQARGVAEIYRVLKPGGRMWVFEVDRGCNMADARTFVSGMRVPTAMRELAVAAFRTYVAGQSLDLDEARALAASLPDENARASRVGSTPALVIAAKKPA